MRGPGQIRHEQKTLMSSKKGKKSKGKGKKTKEKVEEVRISSVTLDG